jgi:hypothetical protein
MSLRTFLKPKAVTICDRDRRQSQRRYFFFKAGKIRLAVAVLGQTSGQGYPACNFTLARIADESSEE